MRVTSLSCAWVLALSVAPLSSIEAHADAPPPTTVEPAGTDDAARCATLAGQWKTVEAQNAINPKLGQARAKAQKAESLCKSAKLADKTSGVADYEAALHLLGVRPTAAP